MPRRKRRNKNDNRLARVFVFFNNYFFSKRSLQYNRIENDGCEGGCALFVEILKCVANNPLWTEYKHSNRDLYTYMYIRISYVYIFYSELIFIFVLSVCLLMQSLAHNSRCAPVWRRGAGLTITPSVRRRDLTHTYTHSNTSRRGHSQQQPQQINLKQIYLKLLAWVAFYKWMTRHTCIRYSRFVEIVL